jgi:hypothetical protein
MAFNILDGELAKEIYTDLAKPTAVKLGKAFETISGLLEAVLLPAKGWSEKRGLLYQHNMRRIANKLENLDSKDVIDIRPELGIPVLEKLSYTQSHDISELFINLLTSAASRKSVEKAHPTFISIINSLSVDEAKILSFLSENKYTSIPFIFFKVNNSEIDGYSLSDRYPIIIKEVELIYPNQIEVYMQNMVGLGLFALVENKHLIGDTDRIDKEMHYYIKLEGENLKYLGHTDESDIVSEMKVGCYKLTKLGEMFIEVCTEKEPHVKLKA